MWKSMLCLAVLSVFPGCYTPTYRRFAVEVEPGSSLSITVTHTLGDENRHATRKLIVSPEETILECDRRVYHLKAWGSNNGLSWVNEERGVPYFELSAASVPTIIWTGQMIRIGRDSERRFPSAGEYTVDASGTLTETGGEAPRKE